MSMASAKSGLRWDDEAQRKLKRVPVFVRSMVRQKVEEYARGAGKDVVTVGDVDAARRAFFSKSPSQGVAPQEAVTEHGGVGAHGELLEIDDPDVPPVGLIRRLEEEVHARGTVEGPLYTVNACGGLAGCPRAQIDVPSVRDDVLRVIEESGLSDALAARIKGPILSHHKFRVAVTGCPNSCAEPQIKDFGVVGQTRPERGAGECVQCRECEAACKEDAVHVEEDGPVFDRERCLNCGDCGGACATGAIEVRHGHKILVGGRLGRRAKLAETLVEFTDAEGVRRALQAAIELFKEEGRGGERFGVMLDRIGLARLKERL
ncbi:MAG: 4Fe-4S dicluster domain-containing protein [Syntrophothermus sp.]